MKNKTKIIIAISSLILIGATLALMLTSCDTKHSEVTTQENLAYYKLKTAKCKGLFLPGISRPGSAYPQDTFST